MVRIYDFKYARPATACCLDLYGFVLPALFYSVRRAEPIDES